MSAGVTQAVSESFVIEGGCALSGRIRANGNKNGALPILAACLLSTEPIRLTNVPRIRDVETMVELLRDMGADVEWEGPNDVRVHAAELVKSELDAELPPPGGDVIGRRRLDTHIHAFEQLGARIEFKRRYTLSTDGLVGRDVFLDEASVMGTENAIMAAVLAKGKTVIGNAACEPHVQDLCRFLVS